MPARGRPDPEPWWRDPALTLFLAVVVLAAIQAVVLGDPVRTLRGAVPALLGAAVVGVGTRAGAGVDETTGRRWLVALGATQVALAAWAVVAFLVALPVGVGRVGGFYAVKLRVSTPLGDHNTVGGLLLVGVVATAVLAQEDRRWWVGTGVVSLGLVASLSRGAAVVLAAAALASWVVGARRRVAAAVTGVALLVLAAIGTLALVLDASPPPGADVPDGPVGTSLVGRVDLAERGVEVMLDDPVLGAGLGGFGERASDLPWPNWHAHNAVAHGGAEGGVPLAAVVVALSLLVLARAWRQPRGWRREVTLLGGAALVVHAQIDILGGLLGHEVLLAVLLVLARGEAARTRR